MNMSRRFLLLMLWLMFSFCGIAHAANVLELWRSKVSETRLLAENNVPTAYTQAQELQKTLPIDATPVDQISILNVLARIELYAGLTDSSAEQAQQAFELAKLHDDKVGQVEADMTIALAAINQADIGRQNNVVMHSMSIVNEINRPDLFGEVMLRTAMMYRRMEQYEDGVAIAVQAMEIAKQNNNSLAMTYACFALASSYDISNRSKEALDIYEKMRDHAIEAHSKLLETDALVGIGRMTFNLGNTVEGERILRETVKSYRSIGAPFYVGHTLFGLAESLRKIGRTTESLPIMDEIVKLYEKGKNKIALWWSLKFRSIHYQALGKTDLANKDAQRSYLLAKEIGFPYYVNQSARQMAALTAIRGNYKQAYQLNVEAEEMSEKSTKEKLGTRMVELAQRYETESKQRKINELNRRNQAQANEIEHRVLQQRWLGTLLGSSVAVTSLTMFFMLHLRRAKEKIESLNVTLEQRVSERTEELYQQKSYLRTLIDTLPLMAWLKDTKSRFIIVNKEFSYTTGKTIEELIGKTDLDFFPKEMAEAYRADDFEVMATLQKKTVEEQIKRANGDIFWAETLKAVVLNQEGNLLGTVGIAVDISDRKAMEEAKENALAEAVRLASLRSEFMARMSHELRTPLNGILGYTQILLKEDPQHSRSHQNEMLQVIEQSGEHLLNLINNILDFAKIEAGKQTLSLNNLRLPVFLHNLINIIRLRAEQKLIKFECDIADDVPEMIRTDEVRLRQVLLNLLANALNYTEQGQISLRVTVLEYGCLRFEVKDSGVGIEAKQLEIIFHPFEQAINKPYNNGGTGLGLAISREIVKLMGSDIHVMSHVGEGSIFWFDLDVTVIPTSDTTTICEIPAVNCSAESTLATPEHILIIPPAEEMNILHHLALEGSMRSIIDQAEHIANLDPRITRLQNDYTRWRKVTNPKVF